LNNKYWFAFEIKEKGKRMPYGQSLSYTRNADKWRKCGDVSYVFVVTHNVEDPTEHIMLKDCLLADVYHQGKWYKAKDEINVTQIIERLKKTYNITKI
jgi:hypothetical protein